MPVRVPVTNLRNESQGGAPIYVGGDTKLGAPVATPPHFTDDSDPYFNSTKVTNRGLFTIVHIPPAGSNTVDFVTLFCKNNGSSRQYVNILLGSDISVEIRTFGTLVYTPVYGDVLISEYNSSSSEITTTMDENNAVSMTISSTDTFDLASPPRIAFDPPVNGNLDAFVNLNENGKIQGVNIVNPNSHTFVSPPHATLVGGKFDVLGFFEDMDKNTLLDGVSSGTITLIGTTCRTSDPSNVAVGDVVIIQNELRVVRRVVTTTEFNIDNVFTTSQTTFEEWYFIAQHSTSNNSFYRHGPGSLSRSVTGGESSLVTSKTHHLCVGDYVIYRVSDLYFSKRVTRIISATEFEIESESSLAIGMSVEWSYVYLLSQPSTGGTHFVRTLSLVRTSVTPILGLGGQRLFISNKNYFNTNGSFFNPNLADDARSVYFTDIALAHDVQNEFHHDISPHTVLELEVKPNPSPEIQALSGYPINGGATSTQIGKRPIVAAYVRGSIEQSSNVILWGYYMRYSPETGTNFTQAINIS